MGTMTEPSGRPSGAVPDRIFDRIRRDFPADDDTALVVRLLGRLDPPPSAGGSERILAALLVLANGRLSGLQDAIDLYRIDWRDLLCAAGFADDDWSQRVDRFLEGL